MQRAGTIMVPVVFPEDTLCFADEAINISPFIPNSPLVGGNAASHSKDLLRRALKGDGPASPNTHIWRYSPVHSARMAALVTRSMK